MTWQERQSIRGFTVGAPQRHTRNACALGYIGCGHAPLDPPGANKPPQ